MLCAKCQFDNPEGASLCHLCGAALAQVCAACTAPVVAGQRFCGNCGSALPQQAGVQPREVPAGYTPRHLIEKVLTTRTSMEGERKQVTVMFCDIAGSTPLAQRLGAEGMHELLDYFFRRALAEVHHLEGTVNQFLGDGFMALFGAPINHEDHARRALTAACAVRRECHAAQYDAATRRVPLRIGLNTGHVVVGKIGDNLRMDYTANGDTTHLAARLNQLAAPGEILVSDTTRAANRRGFQFKSIGERRLRGIADPVLIYNLLDERQKSSDTQSARDVSPLIGRQPELSQLIDCIARLRNGRGGIVGLFGEPGIGKSRLIQELRNASPTDVHWLDGCALSFGKNLSYGPFMEVFRGLLPSQSSEEKEIGWEAAERFLREQLGADAVAHLPYFGLLLGLELPPVAKALVAKLEPIDVRGQIFITARRLAEAICRRRPHVLIVDDWHWADDASQALLEHLMPLTMTAPLLMLVAGRADPEGASARFRSQASEAYPGSYEELVLHPLSASLANEFVDYLLDVDQLPNVVRGVILRKAEGNPLFLEEIAQSLHDLGALRKDPLTGRAQLATDLDVVNLPDRIETLIMARIDRLGDDVKHVLRLASVIGRSFYQKILAILDEAEGALDANLKQLQELEFIRKRRQIPEIEYVFKHTLVQEASYRSILEEKRRQLHHRVGSAIEKMFPNRLDEFAGILAYHFVRAEDWDRAHAFLLRAGDQAGSMAADADALYHYQAAMEIYAKSHGDRWDARERAVLERKIGEACLRMGMQEQAFQHFERSLRLLGYRPPKNRGVVLGAIGWHLGRQLLRHATGGRLLDARKPMTMEDRERLEALIGLTWVDFYFDAPRFFLDVLVILGWSESRAGAEKWASMASSGMAIAMEVAGFRTLASHYGHRARQSAEHIDDPVAKATAALAIGVTHTNGGHWNEAIRELDTAAEIFGKQTRMRERLAVLPQWIWLFIQQGRLEEARAQYADLSRYASDSGDPIARAYSQCYQAMFEAFDGHFSRAIDGYETAIKSMMDIMDWDNLCGVFGDSVQCALWAGRLDKVDQFVALGERTFARRRIIGGSRLMFLVAKAESAVARCLRHHETTKRPTIRDAIACARALRKLASRTPCARPHARFYEGCVDFLSGRRDVAAATIADAIEMTKTMGAAYLTAEMKCLAGSMLSSEEWLSEACEAFAAMRLDFPLARALGAHGELLAPSMPHRAVAVLRRSQAMLERMDAGYEAARVEKALSRIGAQSRDHSANETSL